MLHVAFFRNLNQGQRNNPGSAALIAAFEAHGATEVRLVRGNGTALFSATAPRATAEAAASALTGSGWSDIVLVRSVHQISEILKRVGDEDHRNLEVTLFDEAQTPQLPLAGRRCEAIAVGPGYAIVANERDNESGGTSALERALGVKATSRGLGTVRMLVR